MQGSSYWQFGWDVSIRWTPEIWAKFPGACGSGAACRCCCLRGRRKRALAPEEIGCQSEGEEHDGDGQIEELRGIFEGQVHRVGHDRASRENEDQRCPGIARDAVGKRLALGSSAQGKNGRGA